MSEKSKPNSVLYGSWNAIKKVPEAQTEFFMKNVYDRFFTPKYKTKQEKEVAVKARKSIEKVVKGTVIGLDTAAVVTSIVLGYKYLKGKKGAVNIEQMKQTSFPDSTTSLVAPVVVTATLSFLDRRKQPPRKEIKGIDYELVKIGKEGINMKEEADNHLRKNRRSIEDRAKGRRVGDVHAWVKLRSSVTIFDEQVDPWLRDLTIPIRAKELLQALLNDEKKIRNPMVMSVVRDLFNTSDPILRRDLATELFTHAYFVANPDAREVKDPVRLEKIAQYWLTNMKPRKHLGRFPSEYVDNVDFEPSHVVPERKQEPVVNSVDAVPYPGMGKVRKPLDIHLRGNGKSENGTRNRQLLREKVDWAFSIRRFPDQVNPETYLALHDDFLTQNKIGVREIYYIRSVYEAPTRVKQEERIANFFAEFVRKKWSSFKMSADFFAEIFTLIENAGFSTWAKKVARHVPELRGIENFSLRKEGAFEREKRDYVRPFLLDQHDE